MSIVDHRFRCMGSELRLLIEADDADALATRAESMLHRLDRALSRFDPESELCALNADARTTVPVSATLAAAVSAGLRGAERTGGLVDPTLIGPLEAAGYRASMADMARASLADALRHAPRRRAARPAARAAWRDVTVDAAARTVSRPPGLRLDTGGIGKGLAADAVAVLLTGADRFAVDCAGDLAVGGRDLRPHRIEVQHPLTREIVHVLDIARGGVATSGLDRHLWEHAGGHAHHLLDPSTGRPAWTGLIAATAVAPSAVEAEVLAKAALLSGPASDTRFLAAGGVLFHDDGRFTVVGARPRLTTRDLLGATA